MDDGLHRLAILIALRIWFPRSSNHVCLTLAYARPGADLAYSSWRWAYGIGCMYSLIVVMLIALFMEETWVTSLFASNYF
jgi:hypothetical protein